MDQPDESRPLPPAIRRFLEVPRYATIATLLADGTPHQAVVWYAVGDDDTILINSRRGRVWPANLERDPRISIAVFDEAQPEHWVRIRGRAQVLRHGEPAVGDIRDLARRYDETDEGSAFIGQDRITFGITVESSFEYGDH